MSCSYSTTSNTISYHGTDLQNTSEPFTYVAKDLNGTAKTSYSYRGGGDTRNGLIADAFEDLNRQFGLSVNQTFANVAIDLMEIESGIRTPLLLSLFSGISYFPSMFEVVVNVRADVIEFNNDSPFTPNTTKSPLSISTGSMDTTSKTLPNISESKSNESIEETIKRNAPQTEEFEIGQEVLVTFNGKEYSGVVDRKGNTDGIISYKVRLEVNGKVKSKWFFASKVKAQ